MAMCLDNEALFNICLSKLSNPHPTYADMNQMVAHVMAGITCPFRFPGQLNADLRKMSTNLIPFPRMHFLINSYAPLTGRRNLQPTELSVPELVQDILNPRNMMVSVNPN